MIELHSCSYFCERPACIKTQRDEMRDNGTLRLGPHYAAFPETRSRDSFRWNVNAIRKALDKMAVAA